MSLVMSEPYQNKGSYAMTPSESLHFFFLLHDLPSTTIHISDDKHGRVKRHLCPHKNREIE